MTFGGYQSISNTYDAAGRRETLEDTPLLQQPTNDLNFLHDGSSLAGWYDSVTLNSWDFLNAGGGALAGAYTSGGTTTNYVPLVDAAGTVIALVNPASASSPSTTYTYDPSGNPSMAGASSNWPFLYQGMEHESIDPTSSIIQATEHIIARRSCARCR